MKDLKTQFGVAQETIYQHWNHFMTPIGWFGQLTLMSYNCKKYLMKTLIISVIFLLNTTFLFSQFKGRTEQFKFGTKNINTGKFEWNEWVRIEPISVHISSDSIIINSLTKQVYYIDKINDNLKSGEAMVLDVHNTKNEKLKVYLFTEDDFDRKYLMVNSKNESWMYELEN